MGCIYKELLINTSININFRIMNKKFSTLALGLLLSAFGVNAAETSITIADAVKTAGDYFYLKSGSNYLAITKTADEKADSIIYESDVTKAPMWTIVKSDYSADQKQLYKITSKTGVALSFKKDKNATPKVMDGVNQWLLRSKLPFLLLSHWLWVELRI